MSGPRMPTTTLEAQWRRTVPFVLGACLIDLQRTIEVRAIGVTGEEVPQPLRPLWREMCAQADEGQSDLDVARLKRLLGVVEPHEEDAIKRMLSGFACDGGGHHVATHAKLMRELWLRLQLAQATKNQVAAIEINDEPSAIEYGTALQSAEEIRAQIARLSAPARTWSDIVYRAHEAATNRDMVIAYSTGLPMLDEHLGGGWRPGWLVVVMGAAKSGKTALAVNGFACETAKRGHRTLVISLEMTEEQQAQRMLARESGVPLRAQQNADLSGWQIGALTNAADHLAAWPMDVVTGLGTVSEICDTVRDYHHRHGLVLVVVDYLQLIANGGDNRVLDLEQSTRALKLLAVKLGIVVVLLSQPNNASAKDGDPGLFDGKGSGSIAADCDAMVVPLRDPKEPDRAGLNLVGCRHASPKRWALGSLVFDGGRTLFTEQVGMSMGSSSTRLEAT